MVSLVSERVIKRRWSLFCLWFLCENVMFRSAGTGTSLVVQWSRLHDLNSGDLGLIPGWGTRSHMPQLRFCIQQWRFHVLQPKPGTAKLKKEERKKSLKRITFKRIKKKNCCNHFKGTNASMLGMLSCFSPVRLFMTLWTVAHKATLFKAFSKQEY